MKHTFFILSLLLSTSSCQESFDERLTREANEFTAKHCPQHPEPGTRLDSVSYNSVHRTYTFWYALTSQNASILQGNGKALMHEIIAKQLRADINYKKCKDEGITFRYVYCSQDDGNVIFETMIEKGEYDQQSSTPLLH